MHYAAVINENQEKKGQQALRGVKTLVDGYTNGDIDFQALEKYINFLLDHDSQILITTVGTSRFNLLENDEIKSKKNPKGLIESSNKILITGRLNIGLVRTAPYLYPIFLLRDSTEICIHDSASNRTRATTHTIY